MCMHVIFILTDFQWHKQCTLHTANNNIASMYAAVPSYSIQYSGSVVKHQHNCVQQYFSLSLFLAFFCFVLLCAQLAWTVRSTAREFVVSNAFTWNSISRKDRIQHRQCVVCGACAVYTQWNKISHFHSIQLLNLSKPKRSDFRLYFPACKRNLLLQRNSKSGKPNAINPYCYRKGVQNYIGCSFINNSDGLVNKPKKNIFGNRRLCDLETAKLFTQVHNLTRIQSDKNCNTHNATLRWIVRC